MKVSDAALHVAVTLLPLLRARSCQREPVVGHSVDEPREHLNQRGGQEGRLPQQVQDAVAVLYLTDGSAAAAAGLLVPAAGAEFLPVSRGNLLDDGDGLLRPSPGLQPARALGKVEVVQDERRAN